jgi:hypothetical protein
MTVVLCTSQKRCSAREGARDEAGSPRRAGHRASARRRGESLGAGRRAAAGRQREHVSESATPVSTNLAGTRANSHAKRGRVRWIRAVSAKNRLLIRGLVNQDYGC